MKRRRFIVGAVATATAAAGAVTATDTWPVDNDAAAATSDSPSTPALETASVRRDRLSSEREFKATVSHGEQWTIGTTAAGIITGSHEAGTEVGFGQWLVRIDDKPLTLAEGVMPLYRELRLVDTAGRDANGNRLTLQSGPDVSQLQAFLLDAGFDAKGKLENDGEFGRNTERAIKAWQESAGLDVTGRVDSSQLVFEPEPVRLAADGRVGDPFTTLEVTRAEASVLVETSTRDRSALPPGTEVAIGVNGEAVAGSVTGQKQTTTQDGSSIWRTTIKAKGELPADATAVTVTVTQVVADDVLLVPVASLLALGEGGFAVETPDGPTTRLIRVEVGEVLDGFAEIDGDIGEGDLIVVPT